jgi:hypothetical protein
MAVYVAVDEVRGFLGVSQDELPDSKVQEAIEYARGFIDDYCETTFTEPAEPVAYYYDGNGTDIFLAPRDGPFQVVGKIEHYSGGEWVEYQGKYWIKSGGEILQLESPAEIGVQNWRITAKCWTQLDTYRASLLRRAALLLCRLYLVPRDEPVGPSIRSISYEGISYTYQTPSLANPTGNSEIDYLLRILRRSVIRV